MPSTAITTFLIMPELVMTLPTLSDIDRQPKFKMAVTQPEVELTIDRK